MFANSMPRTARPRQASTNWSRAARPGREEGAFTRSSSCTPGPGARQWRRWGVLASRCGEAPRSRHARPASAGLSASERRMQGVPPMDRPLVLLAEDDAEFRYLLACVLETEGYEVLQAADGMELLANIEASRTRADPFL